MPIEFDPIGIGTAATFFLIAGLLVAAMFLGAIKKTKMKQYATWGIVIFGILGILTSGWLVTEAVTVEPEVPVAWDVDVSEAQAWVTSTDPFRYTVQMSFNDTSDAFVGQTQYCQLSVNVRRADTGNEPAFTTAVVTDVGDYTSATATYGTRDIVAKNTDGTYQATWTDSNSGTSNMEMTIPRLDTMRVDSATINITADAVTVAGMPQYAEVTTTIDVGGQIIWVTWEKVTVTT